MRSFSFSLLIFSMLVYFSAWGVYSHYYPIEIYIFIWATIFYIILFLFIFNLFCLLIFFKNKQKTNKYSLFFSLIATSLVLFYIIINLLWILCIVVGLNYWGNIATLEILINYSYQTVELFSLLDLPHPLWFVIGVFVFLVLLFCWIYIKARLLSIHQSLNIFYQHWKITLLTTVFFPMSILYAIQSIQTLGPLSSFLHNVEKNTELQSLKVSNAYLNKYFESHAQLKKDYPQQNIKEAPTIIFITVDALRYDKTSLGGNPRNTTPYLLDLKINKGLYDAGMVRSNCAESTCGIISLLSSSESNHLTPYAFTLFNALKQAGYQSHAILAGDHRSFYGLKNIYAASDTYYDGLTKNDNSYVNDDSSIVLYIKNLNIIKNKPAFYYIHLMGVHTMGVRPDKFKKWLPTSASTISFTQQMSTERKIKFFNNYDNGVLATDYKIKEIYQAIENKKLNKNILLIVTADHGEFVGEKDIYSHAKTLYEPVLNTPLFLLGFKKEFVLRAARQHDIAPTILYELGLQMPSTFEGVPLQLQENREFSLHQQNLDVALVRNDGFKWIQNQKSKATEIYNLKTDPHELYNLSEIADKNIERAFLKELLRRKFFQVN